PLVLSAQVDSRENGDTVFVTNSSQTAGEEQLERTSIDTERILETRNLASDCRLIVSESSGANSRSSIRLQCKINSVWQVIASYDCAGGRSARTRYASNGNTSRMNLNLPQAVVRQMALEDFTRNFRFHQDAFRANRSDAADVSSGVR